MQTSVSPRRRLITHVLDHRNLVGSPILSVTKTTGQEPKDELWMIDIRDIGGDLYALAKNDKGQSRQRVAANDDASDDELIPSVDIVFGAAIADGDRAMVEIRNQGDPKIDQKIQVIQVDAGAATSQTLTIDVSVVAPGANKIMVAGIGVGGSAVFPYSVDIDQGAAALVGSHRGDTGGSGVVMFDPPIVFDVAGTDIAIVATYASSTNRRLWVIGWYE